MNQFIHPVRTTHDGIEIVATVCLIRVDVLDTIYDADLHNAFGRHII